jgi:RNA polymerase sigma factor (sigma-70 family)
MEDQLEEIMRQNATALSPRAKKALEDHIRDYKRLILKMAHKYKRHRVEYDDLVQEAMIGLILADRDFDETRSRDFHTYAIYRMKGKMYEYCIANESPIYVPTHIAKAAAYVKQMQRLLEAEPSFTTHGIESDKIIAVSKHPFERKLPTPIAEQLTELKRKLGRIAHNSKRDYESLTKMAFESISLIVSEDALLKLPQEEVLDDWVASKRMSEDLERSLGPKRFAALKLRAAGWNYREIAEALFDLGYANKRGEVISRQAVKGILDETIKAIRRSRAFASFSQEEEGEPEE